MGGVAVGKDTGGKRLAGEEPRTVRPYLAMRIGAPAGYAGILALVASEPIDGPGEVACAALFVVLLGVVIGMAVRERLEIEPGRVRIVRLFSEDVLPLEDLDRVAQSGGKGRPRYLARREGVTVPVRALDLRRWPPRTTVESTTVKPPGLMTSRQIAHALGIPLTTYSGQPITDTGWADAAGEAFTEKGHLRPFYWVFGAVIAVLIGLVVAMVLYPLGG